MSTRDRLILSLSGLIVAAIAAQAVWQYVTWLTH